MNSDATEAALGLLGLLDPTINSPASGPIPGGGGGGGGGVGGDIRGGPSRQIIPLKRKQPPPAAHPGPAPARREKEKEGRIHDETQFNPDAINCICGSLYDDGFSIACDDCSRWCHAACFDIVAGEVPEEWKCWVCVPRAKGVDRERAARMQKERQREAERIQQEQARMRLSPGVERAKPRSR
ncbi:hypothetical protein FIBSPDRAFT_610017, partial [Athelia psychrophila]